MAPSASSVKLVDGVEALVIDIEPRRNIRSICPECSKWRNVYDRQPQRLFEYLEYLPIWAFKVYFRYAPRRVDCPTCSVKVKALPWVYGKKRITFS
jgi:transposase